MSYKKAKKLAKKLDKKLHKKEVKPILSLLLTVLTYLTSLFINRKEETRKPANHPASQANASPSRPPQSVRLSNGLADATLQGYIDQAQAYQREIEWLVQSTSNTLDRQRLQELAAQVREWTQAVISLAQRVDGFRQNRLIRQDLKTVPTAIASLEERLAEATDPVIRRELERTLANRQKQQANLIKLQQTIQWAEIKIESTVSMLGTIYSQLLTGQSRNHVADYRRLLNEVDEELLSLQDHLAALEEVKLGTSVT
jgi:hypothetical protein